VVLDLLEDVVGDGSVVSGSGDVSRGLVLGGPSGGGCPYLYQSFTGFKVSPPSSLMKR